MKITQTQSGPAIMLDRDLMAITSERWQTAGSIGLGIMLDRNELQVCFALFWEWGGDWSCFADGAEHDAEQLDGWEPAALREAAALAIAACPECEDDMHWYLDWAGKAEKTFFFARSHDNGCDASYTATWADVEDHEWSLPCYAIENPDDTVTMWSKTDEAGVDDVVTVPADGTIEDQVAEYADELAGELGELVKP